MKNSVKWILMATVSVIVFVGIFFAYNKLKADYDVNDLKEVSEVTDQTVTETQKTAAPDFTVYDENGNAVKLSDFVGKPVVLNFWASWCYYCKEEMPDFDKAAKNHTDVRFLMVNVTDGRQETLDTAKAYIESNGFAFPVFYDTNLEATYAYGAYGLPMSVFINADGEIVTYASGMMTAESLEEAITLIKE